MRMTSMIPGSVFLVAVAACGGGGDGGGSADARVNVMYDADLTQPDAAVSACSATGDHTESDEAGNDPFATEASPEATGQTISAGGAAFTVGGCIDPLQATAEEADGDFYSFTVGGTDATNVRIELTSDDGASLTSLNVLLIVETPEGLALIDTGVWSAAVGGGLIGRADLDPGEYFIAVYADLPAPAVAVPYSIRVLEYTSVCAPAGVDYTESTDAAAGNRANDMVEIVYGAEGTEYTPTAADDTPEVSGVTVNLGGAVQIAGDSANVAAAGDYYDADTYEISIGDDVDELYLSVNWDMASSADMDFFIFPVLGTNNPVGSGTLISTSGEIAVLNVAPNTTYWLWVGTYNDQGVTLPQAYTVDICGATSFPTSP